MEVDQQADQPVELCDFYEVCVLLAILNTMWLMHVAMIELAICQFTQPYSKWCIYIRRFKGLW
jgi:hypothetical protein